MDCAARVAPERRCIPACLPRSKAFGMTTREVGMNESAAVSALWEKYRQHYPVPGRPLHSKLMGAYVERLARFLQVVLTTRLDLANLQPHSPELGALSSELTELYSFLGDNSLFPRPMSPHELGQFLIDQKLSFELTESAVKSMERRPLGHPVTVRALAVKAHELKTAQALSWQQLAVKLCQCDLGQHGPKCSQRIRQAVLSLKRKLAKYKITFP
jgi:hypothetical protein